MEVSSIQRLLNAKRVITASLLFLILVNMWDQPFQTVLHIIIILATTLILDIAINLIKEKKLVLPDDAAITGLLIASILMVGAQWWVLVIAGAAAIITKHVIRWKHRTVFNPAMAGILIATLFFGAAHTWWASTPWWLVLILGLVVVWRIHSFTLWLSYLIAHAVLFGAYALIADLLIIPTLLLNNLFFASFMLIEPISSPIFKRSKIIYGILVATLFLIFHLTIPQHDIILALVAANIAVPFLNALMK